MSEQEHPARLASHRSMKAVMAGDRETWLSLFAEGARVEDPIGKSPIDPSGEGHTDLEKFWDGFVAGKTFQFEVHDSFACGSEVANVLTLTTKAGKMTFVLDGVFTYRVDADGKILNLRGFWEFERSLQNMKMAD